MISAINLCPCCKKHEFSEKEAMKYAQFVIGRMIPFNQKIQTMQEEPM